MFKRTFISAGDTTTSGGRVEPKPQSYPMTYDGRLTALEGDPVWCPACKTYGITKCVMPYLVNTAPSGQQQLMDGDLCICQCAIPPRLIGSLTHYFFEFESHDILASGPACAGWIKHMGLEARFPLLAGHRHGKRFQFNHSETGEPLRNRTVVVEENGAVREMKTDIHGGLTVPAEVGSSIKVHLVFESPLGEMIYGADNA